MTNRLLGSFQKFARTVVRTSGHPMAFGLAIGVIVLWLLTGPFFHFGNTWLLVIDTVANIITFLMIFLIRNAQNRESEAVQLKLDELIRATKEARNTLLDIEELSETELDKIKTRFERLARKARDESSVAAREPVAPEDSPKLKL
jgi:low affinity Fe/Cu permease